MDIKEMLPLSDDAISSEAQEAVFSHASGYIDSAQSPALWLALCLAEGEACKVADGVAKATGDAEAAAEAGIYAFDLLRAVVEGDENV